jgi:hypothetical protein
VETEGESVAGLPVFEQNIPWARFAHAGNDWSKFQGIKEKARPVLQFPMLYGREHGGGPRWDHELIKAGSRRTSVGRQLTNIHSLARRKAAQKRDSKELEERWETTRTKAVTERTSVSVAETERIRLKL